VTRPLLLTFCLVGAAFVACQVYDPSLLSKASGQAGRGTGGQGASAGAAGTAVAGGGTSGSSTGGLSSGGAGDGGTSTNLEGGAGGEGGESSGATAGAGGSVAGASGNGGASGGAAGSSGTSGQGGAAGAGAGGKAGTAGAAGVAGNGGAGNGGAGNGGAGNGGAGTSGTAGSGGTGPIVVELMGTATADSEENTTSQMHPATHGNDGDGTTRWCAANGNANHYWTLDLGAVHQVTRLEVTWEYPPAAVGLPYRYRVDISSNGTTFTSSIDKTANTEVTPTQSVNFPAGTMARHVRIVVTGLPTGGWASFFEASVYGY
jgi:hypothetical protein